MGDKNYLHPVALQWDQGPELLIELKKLKKKVQKYFQSKSESGGGECEIQDTDCSRGHVLIYFKEKEAQERVLKKNSHQIVIKDQTKLQLQVFTSEAIMGIFSSSHDDSGDKGASGSPEDTDHQQDDNQNSDPRKRKSDSRPDPGLGDEHSTRDLKTNSSQTGAFGGEEPNNSSSAAASWTENEDNPPRKEARRNSLSRRSIKEPVEESPADLREIFDKVTARLDKKLFSEDLPEQIQAEMPSLTIKDERDFVKVTGTYREIQVLHEYLQGKLELNAKKPSDTPRSGTSETPRSGTSETPRSGTSETPRSGASETPRSGASETPRSGTSDTPRSGASEIPRSGASEIPRSGASETPRSGTSETPRSGTSETPRSGTSGTAETFSPTDIQAHRVCFPSALYEYIMEIYRTEVDVIERRHGVKIDHHSSPEGSTHVSFIPLGSDSSPEKAREIFTDKVQKVTGDWSQERVDPSGVPLTFSDIEQRVKDRWRKILVLQEGNTDIILRGPRDELSQAIQFLKKDDYKPARPRRAPTISSGDIRTEIPVDVRHMDILKKLKSREISDIERKYNVKMDEVKKNGGVLVTFRAIDATPDLSPHASHSFTTLLQKTFFNIEKKLINVKPEFQEERVGVLQEELMMQGVDIVMEYSSGSVLLIGHPVHVAFAAGELSGSQNSGRDQGAASRDEAMDTSGSSVDNQPKAEEADKCPVCMCEIEDKDKEILEKCKHAYCRGCLQRLMAHKPVCAICGVLYGTITGDQPDGTMTDRTDRSSLPGYPGCGTIEIHYNISGGIQKENHPHPGRHLHGTGRTAYLPDNEEGRDILRLLRKAFDQRLIFTVGESRTTGATDAVTWNDIHHKTSTSGGPQSFGYPDPDYLKRVRDELKAKGIE